MNDFFLFFIGCLVTLVVASAVGLLMWGAYNDPPRADEPEAEEHRAPPALQRKPVEAFRLGTSPQRTSPELAPAHRVRRHRDLWNRSF